MEMTNEALNSAKTGTARARNASPKKGPRLPESSRETAHDILRTRVRPLDSIFSPRVVAVVGATERKRSVGRTVMENLLQGRFPGRIFPVNPIQNSILGLKAY